MAEIIVFRAPDGSEQSYHSVQDSATVREYLNNPALVVSKRFRVPDPGGHGFETPAERSIRIMSEGYAPERRRIAAAALPYVAGMVGSALVPEVGIPMWAARIGAAGLAGGAGEAGAQAMRGERPSLPGIVAKGGEIAAGQGVGEALSPLFQLGARGLADQALRRTPVKVAAQNVANESRIAGETLSPEDATVGMRMLEENVAPGRLPWEKETGYQKVAASVKEATDARNAALDRLGQQGKRLTTFDAVGPNVKRLRDKWAKLNRLDLQDWLTERLTEFHQAARVQKGGVPTMKPQKFTPREFQERVTEWDKAAKAPHEKAAGTRAGGKPAADKEAEFMKAVADDGRLALRDLTPPAIKGGVGEVERLNRAIYRNMPLEEAMKKAEMPGGGRLNWPATSTAAVLGGGVGALGGPMGAVEGAGAGALLERLLSIPAVGGRAALVMNNPATREAARAAPVSLEALLRMMQARNKPDSLATQ